jgi:ferrochelatase
MGSRDGIARNHGHRDVPSPKVGVLLVNLGTPERCDVKAVRHYLAEFLSDQRVIELNPLLWKFILHGFILRFRPPRMVRAYRKIWMEDTDESPLRFHTRMQSDRLAGLLKQQGDKIIVQWAMRYGTPSIPDGLGQLRKLGCGRILIAALYPQYSATTTATVHDKVFECLAGLRDQPSVRTLAPYYDHPGYIEALAESVEAYLKSTPERPQVLIASYHGLPMDYVEAGDPYYCHCAKTTRLLRQRLGMDDNLLRMTFQSRIGPKQWLQPYTDQTLAELADSGVRRVGVLTPGFSADCLETLEEIAIQNRALFLERGGECFDYLPCLNASDSGIKLLASLIKTELAGWI